MCQPNHLAFGENRLWLLNGSRIVRRTVSINERTHSLHIDPMGQTDNPFAQYTCRHYEHVVS